MGEAKEVPAENAAPVASAAPGPADSVVHLLYALPLGRATTDVCCLIIFNCFVRSSL